jgi:hypothetical protein
VEDEAVRAGVRLREVADPAVVVGLAVGEQLVAAKELDADAPAGLAPLGVEDVRRDHACIFYEPR